MTEAQGQKLGWHGPSTMERARIRTHKKIFWYGLVAVCSLLLITALPCFYIEKRLRSTLHTPQIWPIAPQLEGIRIRTYNKQLKVSPLVTLRIDQLKLYQQMAKLVLKVKCLSAESAVISYPVTCSDVYFQQIEGHGVIHERRISLNDQDERDWTIDLQGRPFFYPFDRYTAVGEIGGTVIFFPEGEVSEFNATMFTDWNPRDWNFSDGPYKAADIKSAITIFFSRPCWLWFLAFLWLGGLGGFSIFASWIYRGIHQVLITLLAFPLTWFGLRESIFTHVKAPTFFDMVWTVVFVICVLIFLIPWVLQRRISTD